jgi:putative oxidoreductase
MTSVIETTANHTHSAARSGRKLQVAVWAAQVLLALFFLGAAMPKLLGDPTAVATFRLFGLGDWFIYFVAAVEVAGAIGLLIPRLCGLASIGLVALMAGATVANVFVLPGAAPAAAMTVPLAVAFALIARYRWTDTKALAGLFRQ